MTAFNRLGRNIVNQNQLIQTEYLNKSFTY